MLTGSLIGLLLSALITLRSNSPRHDNVTIAVVRGILRFISLLLIGISAGALIGELINRL